MTFFHILLLTRRYFGSDLYSVIRYSRSLARPEGEKAGTRRAGRVRSCDSANADNALENRAGTHQAAPAAQADRKNVLPATRHEDW